MIDIKEIQSLYKDMKVVFTDHFLDRIQKRGISFSNIRAAVNNGHVIEQYSDDYPYPSALVSGHSNDDMPLHVVIGIGNGLAWLITAYYPSSDLWEADYRTRKVGN